MNTSLATPSKQTKTKPVNGRVNLSVWRRHKMMKNEKVREGKLSEHCNRLLQKRKREFLLMLPQNCCLNCSYWKWPWIFFFFALVDRMTCVVCVCNRITTQLRWNRYEGVPPLGNKDHFFKRTTWQPLWSKLNLITAALRTLIGDSQWKDGCNRFGLIAFPVVMVFR